MSPLSVLNDIGFSAVTLSIWVVTSPLSECATTTPDTCVSVTGPFRLFASISPSTFSTTTLPSFMQPSLREVAAGTWRLRSTGRSIEPVLTLTTLSSSSTVRPVVAISMRLRPSVFPPEAFLFDVFTPRSRASTTTSLPSYPLTLIPPFIRLTFTIPGRDGSRKGTDTRSAGTSWPNATAPIRNAEIDAIVCLRLFIK